MGNSSKEVCVMDYVKCAFVISLTLFVSCSFFSSFKCAGGFSKSYDLIITNKINNNKNYLPEGRYFHLPTPLASDSQFYFYGKVFEKETLNIEINTDSTIFLNVGDTIKNISKFEINHKPVSIYSGFITRVNFDQQECVYQLYGDDCKIESASQYYFEFYWDSTWALQGNYFYAWVEYVD